MFVSLLGVLYFRERDRHQGLLRKGSHSLWLHLVYVLDDDLAGLTTMVCDLSDRTHHQCFEGSDLGLNWPLVRYALRVKYSLTNVERVVNHLAAVGQVATSQDHRTGVNALVSQRPSDRAYNLWPYL